MESMIVDVVGHPEKKLRFYPLSSCGGIKNGVAFENGNTGGWVISYEDFLKMAKLAEQWHSEHKTHQPKKVARNHRGGQSRER